MIMSNEEAIKILSIKNSRLKKKERALVALYENHKWLFIKQSGFAVYNSESRQDLMQDYFLVLQDCVKKYIDKDVASRGTTFSQYLKSYVICHNKKQMKIRKEISVDVEAPVLYNRPDKKNTNEDSELKYTLQQFMQTLSPKEKIMFSKLYKFAGYPQKEIAARMDMSAPNLAYHQRKLKDKYREFISKN